MATTQKRLLVLVLGTMAAVVMAASVAFACAAITTIKLESASAAAGSTIEGRGDAFRHGDGFGNVVLTFENREGQQLWTGPVAEDRTVNFSFSVPDVAPGHYALVATQAGADGKPVPGSPARTTLQVTPAAAASGAAVAQTEAAGSPAPAPAPVEEAAAPAPVAVAPAQASATEQPAAPAPAAPAPATAPTTTAPAATAPAASAPGAAATAVTPEVTQSAPAAVTQPAAAATPKQFTHEATVSPTASTVSSSLPEVREAVSASVPVLDGGLGLSALAAVLGMAMSILFLARKRRSIGMAVARF